jgi:hypothetical protein
MNIRKFPYNKYLGRQTTNASMITKDEVINILLTACPSFQKAWDESENKELLYLVMGDLTRHLLDLYVKQSYCELVNVGDAIEELLIKGDHYVKELTIIGILESIQNVWGHTETCPDKFMQFLKPESRKWWDSLNKFWHKEIPYAGYDITTAHQGDALEHFAPGDL